MSGAQGPLVVTGASGFVGQRLLQALHDARAERVVAVGRSAASLTSRGAWGSTWRALPLDLASTDLPADLLPGATIVHLAAATGRAGPREMRRVNLDATARVMRQASAAGSAATIFVSSIAARYQDRRWYPYAETKREAEALVAASGVPFTIVRPTMVFGPGSPVQRGLTMLASLPIPVLFGAGGVFTQPVHVDDVAAFLLRLASSDAASGAMVELGGADRLSMRALYAKLRAAAGGSSREPLRIPAALMRQVLGAVEPALRPILPVTAGQLAAFVHDSTAQPHELVARYLPAPRGIDDILRAHD
jgi:NADH dehydrogenase